ncbi:MAG: hypothetical protein EOP53_11675, partial [Sphingobacteriales bacterium]
DSAASNFYNIKLSQRRSGEVQRFIQQKVAGKVKLEVKSFGETKPRFKYFSPDAMAKNRRVDIEIQYDLHSNSTEKNVSKTTILDLYKLLETAADTFLINNNYDTILQAANGIVVSIPANTICERENKFERVKVAIKEVLNLSGMISQNASTGSGRNFLITSGMVQITAFTLRNETLQLCEDKSFTVFIPTEKPDENMQHFYASRDKNFGLDWQLQNPEEKLDVVSGIIFRGCNYPDMSGGGTGNCLKCRLFFCKIKNAVKTVCRKIYRKKTYASLKNKRAIAYKSYQKRKMAEELQDRCEDRKKKLTEIEAKYDGINVGRMEQLTEAEMNYYILKTTQMGWINCDRFAGLTQEQLTEVILPMNAAATTDVKLIMQNAVMPSYDVDGKIGFPNVPKGVKATLLGLRFENGQPALAMKEIVIGENENDLEMEFKNFSLSELKKKLAEL